MKPAGVLTSPTLMFASPKTAGSIARSEFLSTIICIATLAQPTVGQDEMTDGGIDDEDEFSRSSSSDSRSELHTKVDRTSSRLMSFGVEESAFVVGEVRSVLRFGMIEDFASEVG